MGGILIALQALMSYRRAKAMEDDREIAGRCCTENRTRSAAGAPEKRHRTPRGINRTPYAWEGPTNSSIWLKTLWTKRRKKICARQCWIFSALISARRRAESEYRETHKSKPSEEVQSLLTLLFVQKHEVFKGCHINLQGKLAEMVPIFRDARLRKRHALAKVNMQKAELHRSGQLQEWRTFIEGRKCKEATLSSGNKPAKSFDLS